MKISPKTFSLFLATFFFLPNPSLAWTGYDYNNKTQIDIGPGNLVREGLIIQFYDQKDDRFHTAKILFQQESAAGTELQIMDLDLKKERTFIMERSK